MSENGKAARRSAPKLRLGGMALQNGVLLHGPTHWAASVRDADGDIRWRFGQKPSLRNSLASKFPGVGVLTRLVEALAVVPVMRVQLSQARLAGEDRTTLSALFGSALVVALLRKRFGASILGQWAVVPLQLVPAAAALKGGELAAYHGAEHKVVAGYETDTDAALKPKEHDRCGSNLVAPIALCSVVSNLVLGRLGIKGRFGQAVTGFTSFAGALELFIWCERNPEAPVSRVVHRLGYEIQNRAGTREPSDRQLDVARTALSLLLEAEDSKKL
jgi:uncharacterized protein YqhQ